MKKLTFAAHIFKKEKEKDVVLCEVVINSEYPKKFKDINEAVFEDREFPVDFFKNFKEGEFLILEIEEGPGFYQIKASVSDEKKVKWAKQIFDDSQKRLSKSMEKFRDRDFLRKKRD